MRYRQLVWCPVYKAASTNWMLNVAKLSNFSPFELQQLRLKFVQPNQVAEFIGRPMNSQV